MAKHCQVWTCRYDVKEEMDKKKLASEITILSAERKDSALFTCLVTNAYGRADMNIRLIVQEAPEPPREVRVTEVKSRTAKITWPPPYTGNSPILRYQLECRLQPATGDGLTHNATIPGDDTHYQLRGLGPAKAYVCRVRAENQLGLGDFSDPISFTTTEEVPGGPPLDVRAEAVDSTTIRVTWRPPARELWNGAIKGYYVGYKVVDSTDSYLYKTLEVGRGGGSAQETVALSLLRRYTRYSVLVQAYNAMGAGPRSDEVVVRTLEDVPSEPPQQVQCAPLTSQSLQVTWAAPPPASIHGVMQGYRVSFRLEGEEEAGRNTTDHELKLSGLLKYANYSLTVAAFNHKGLGQASPPVHCRTLEDVPGPPADLKAVSLSPDTILVRWRPPQDSNGLLTKYSLYWRKAAGPAASKVLWLNTMNSTVIRVQPAHLQHKLPDLADSSRHEFWVTASTSRGEGRPTRVVSHTVTPRVPARVLDFGGPVTAVPGDKVTLGCQIAGIPTPERKWKFRYPIDGAIDKMREEVLNSTENG
ncbi:hypothetical protein LAZ67_8000776 [Cordylochernes scorpioides]|uniref:Uncharacterized protein n=1 Tax=Cordylochernes scorpioides TaxID=51811 RepID=A0ABY6KPS1_9ARAC|nr:hypothetical protein LAZ67_8000776 [Cordylochernes scorpioides]